MKDIVLLVEDDREFRGLLRDVLVTEGFRVFEAGTATEAEEMRVQVPPAAILIDLGLPDGDANAYISHVKQRSSTPVIVVSGRADEVDKVKALDDGADDYITKPFRQNELLARLRGAIRRTSTRTRPRTVLVSGPFRIDLERHEVWRETAQVRLTPVEFRLLARLAEDAGNVVPHRRLLADVWGPAAAHQVQYLRVHMGALRRKLEAHPERPRWLLTEPGVGYRIADA